MSFRGKRELLMQVAPRYSSARHGQRSVILDEFVAVTGYDRKYAIRLLLGPIRPPAPIRRPRAAHSAADVIPSSTPGSPVAPQSTSDPSAEWHSTPRSIWRSRPLNASRIASTRSLKG